MGNTKHAVKFRILISLLFQNESRNKSNTNNIFAAAV
jgi:hypothetical protein